jgi:hypothetical protein
MGIIVIIDIMFVTVIMVVRVFVVKRVLLSKKCFKIIEIFEKKSSLTTLNLISL